MKFVELLGKRLLGFIDLDKAGVYIDVGDVSCDILLLLGKDILNSEKVLLVSDNGDESGFYTYSWYDNWRLMHLPTDKGGFLENEEVWKHYKSIGEEIKGIDVDRDESDVLLKDKIRADMDKWAEAVGTSEWGPAENKNYMFIHIKTNTKVLSLGTVYHSCHYPENIWEYA